MDDIPSWLIWTAFGLWCAVIGFVVGVYVGVKYTEEIIDEKP